MATLGLATSALAQELSRAIVIDSFESTSAWSAAPSDGVSLSLHADSGAVGRSMRLDFDFHGHGGYAIARRKVDLPLPSNYRFSWRIRGESPINTLEFKLVDPSGENVWWSNQRDYDFPREWRTVIRRKRHISFAWGPKGGGDLERVAAIEIAITASAGGKGSVWLDELTLTELSADRPYTGTPVVSATSQAPSHPGGAILDSDSTSAWRPAVGGATRQALDVDFGSAREFGALVLDWEPGRHAHDYAVLVSNDASRWDTVRVVQNADDGRDYLYLPETEARHLRIALTRPESPNDYGLRGLRLEPIDWAPTRNDFFRAIARESPAGDFPRAFRDEQSYWTVVGVNADMREGLFNEDGALDLGKGSFSVEPFVRTGDSLLTYSDVRSTSSLTDGSLPIPSVTWRSGDLTLTTTAFGAGPAGVSSLYATYRLTNIGNRLRRATLYLALRPFQVNPPWQFLGVSGGEARVRTIDWNGARARINDADVVEALTPGARFGATTYDGGEIVRHLRAGRLPSATRVVDLFEHASGAMAWDVTLAPGASRDVALRFALHAGSAVRSPRTATAALGAARQNWTALLSGVRIELPESARQITETIRSSVAYILINRDSAALQPGSRSYERSWIRDGALTSAALLRLGHDSVARAFTEWYAQFQFDNGKIPCCVDDRGADPVPEHDSHGQLIYLVAEYYRYTGDRAFAERMWPHVARAAAYIDSLRQQRRTTRYRLPDSLAYFGLVPQSISHEGYSAKPMHSYWDDFFVLRGLKDAVELANWLGRPERDALKRMRDEFRADLHASIPRAMALHNIDYIPGSVELGDFDATSTTIAVAPVNEAHRLDSAALERTFDKYYQNFVARRDGKLAWENYTPYELRVVGTMVRLGYRDRAHQLLDFFFADQRPAAWRQWGEVVWRDPKTPKFVGDIPHTWVASDYIRSALDMFAYDRESDSSLVVGAGVKEEWVGPGSSGLTVDGLRTPYGALTLSMQPTSDGLRVRVSGVRVPPGGIVIRPPRSAPIAGATSGGQPVATEDRGRQLRIRALPADIVIRY